MAEKIIEAKPELQAIWRELVQGHEELCARLGFIAYINPDWAYGHLGLSAALDAELMKFGTQGRFKITQKGKIAFHLWEQE